MTEVDRLLAENERLRASEARYRMLAENAHAVFTWVSPSVRTLLGWEPEQVVGRRPLDLVHPDDLSLMGAQVARVGRVEHVDFRARFARSGRRSRAGRAGCTGAP